MQFNSDTDFEIFNELLKKRPEITSNSLKSDLKNFLIPYIQKLLDLKQSFAADKGLVVGVSAIQGAGKTTQGEILEILLAHYNKSSVSLSIDDHYITHSQLTQLRQKDPRFIRRGVTHDINLAIKNLTDLINFKSPVLVSGYDKGAHKGDGDRFAFVNLVENMELKAKVIEQELVINQVSQYNKALQLISITFAGSLIQIPENMGANIPITSDFLPEELCAFLNQVENQVVKITRTGEKAYFIGGQTLEVEVKSLPKGWRLVAQKPDFIFYDGWMVGARNVKDESVFTSGLPALENSNDQEFAIFINRKLNEYAPLWNLINFTNVLYVPDYQISLKWRDQAEEALRAKGKGMTVDQIREFVYYFWRSVHPAIQIKNLAQDPNTNQVVIINDDHTIKEVLRPEEVRTKYR